MVDSPAKLNKLFSTGATALNSQKFGRYYILKVETATDEILTLEFPITCEFEVTRNNLSSVNTANFTIYNLNATTRMSLFKDAFDKTTFRLVEFYAGYRNDVADITPLVFKGSIKQCYSERSGSDYKTIIECFDGQQAMTSGFMSETFPAGVNVKDQLKAAISQMPNILGGVFGSNLEGKSARGTVMVGNPADIIKQTISTDFYIDKLNCYVLDTSDVLVGDVFVIDSQMGILDAPKKTETTVTMSILFEPRFTVSQLVQVDVRTQQERVSALNESLLDSFDTKLYNGEYKITGISHKGIISGAVGGDCRTTLTLLSLGGVVPVYKIIPDNNTSNGLRIVEAPVQ